MTNRDKSKEKEEVKKRIDKILSEKKLTAAGFAQITGLTLSNVHELTNARTGKVSANVSVRILKAFPDINEKWLLSGLGNMYVDKNMVAPPSDPQMALFTMMQQQLTSLTQKLDKIEENHKQDMREMKADFQRQLEEMKAQNKSDRDSLVSIIRQLTKGHATSYSSSYLAEPGANT